MLDLSTLVPAGMHNPRIKQYLAVKNNTKSNPEHLACIEGLWALSMAVKAKLEMRCFFVCPDLLRSDVARHLASTIIETGVHSYIVSEKVLCSMADWEGPDGLAALVRLRRFDWQDIPLRRHNRLVVLDGLEIPGNIGTIIRCADGAGADAIVVTRRKKRLSHRKIIHASMGSLFTFPVIEAELAEAIAWLKQHRFRIIITDTNALLNYRQADYQGRVVVVMGNERHGIAREWYEAQDCSVSIPMFGRVDSLNVGNAAVLMLYELCYQQELKQLRQTPPR